MCIKLCHIVRKWNNIFKKNILKWETRAPTPCGACVISTLFYPFASQAFFVNLFVKGCVGYLRTRKGWAFFYEPLRFLCVPTFFLYASWTRTMESALNSLPTSADAIIVHLLLYPIDFYCRSRSRFVDTTLCKLLFIPYHVCKIKINKTIGIEVYT